MFQLNPLASPDAWWQHALMLVVAGIIGYIIGYRSGSGIIESLEGRLALLDVDIEKCKKGLVAARETVVVAKPSTLVAAPIVPDDLKIVEGIGPAIERLLNSHGILTFRQLSVAAPERLKEILENAGSRFRIHDPGTWPKQSELAADGKWDELAKWQDELSGGKEE